MLSLVKAYESSPTTIYLEFHDGISADINYLWLRDSCQCENCINPENKQKLVDTISLDMKVKPKSYSITKDGRLKIVWSEESKEDHISTYLPLWLHRYTLGFQLSPNILLHDILPPISTWRGKNLQNFDINVSYDELMSSQEGVDKVLDNLFTYGIILLNNVPCHGKEVIKIMNRFTFVCNTKWGSSFYVVTKPGQPDPKYLPFTGDYLELHTDMNYLERSPSIQALHCLEVCYEGEATNKDRLPGESFFVDGFAIANWMKSNYPTEYNLLTSLKVKFKIFIHGLEYINHQYVLRPDGRGGVSEVHYNNRTLAPFEGPAKLAADFYRSYQIFGKKLRDKDFQCSVVLKPGDVVIFNNRRVLHGRNRFNPTVAARHLEGCYGDFDEMMARYRHLMRNKLLI